MVNKLASIITFLVLILSIQPDFEWLEEEQSINCCDTCNNDHNNDQSTDNSCNDLNPFQSCCTSCGGFTTDFLAFTMPVASISIISRPAYYQNNFDQFSNDVWQPPRLA